MGADCGGILGPSSTFGLSIVAFSISTSRSACSWMFRSVTLPVQPRTPRGNACVTFRKDGQLRFHPFRIPCFFASFLYVRFRLHVCSCVFSCRPSSSCGWFRRPSMAFPSFFFFLSHIFFTSPAGSFPRGRVSVGRWWMAWQHPCRRHTTYEWTSRTGRRLHLSSFRSFRSDGGATPRDTPLRMSQFRRFTSQLCGVLGQARKPCPPPPGRILCGTRCPFRPTNGRDRSHTAKGGWEIRVWVAWTDEEWGLRLTPEKRRSEWTRNHETLRFRTDGSNAPLPSPRKRTQPRHVGGHWRKGDVDPGRFGSIGRPEQGRSDPTAWEARGAQGQRLVGTQLNQPKARIGLGSRPRAPLRRTCAGSSAWFEAEEETGPCTQARETTMVRRHPRLGNQRTCRLNVHVRQRTIRIDVPSIHIPSKRKITHSSQVSHHALT